MDTVTLRRILFWLVRDTFRQARASGILYLMLAFSAVCILFCFSVSCQGGFRPPRSAGEANWSVPANDPEARKAREHPEFGVAVVDGEIAFGFGAFRAKMFRYREDAVEFIEVVLSTWLAGTAGLLLALVWTAGFLPTFLEPSAATVLLAKPVPRWLLLWGKALGVAVFMTAQTALFVFGTWVALALKTDVGAVAYLLSLPLLVIHFLMIYSVSALTAVWTRSTVACVFVAALFWLITYGLNAGRHFALAWPEVANQGASFALIETLYWILPKPADLNLILQWAINAGNHYPLLPEFQKVVDGWAVSPLQAWLSVLSSLAFALAVLGLAGWEFSKTDY